MSDALIGFGTQFRMSATPTSPTLTKLAEVTNLTLPNEQVGEVDVTHYESADRTREFVPGLNDAGEITIEINWIPGSDTDTLLVAAKADGKVRTMQITTPADDDQQTYTFPGFVRGFERTAPVDDRMTATVTIRVAGAVVQVDANAPAPAFTTQPSISPSTGPVGTTFTASDGAASNSTSYTRRWLLGSTAIGTGTTVTPNTAGSLTLEVTATGPGGSTTATSAAVTVAAAPTPTYASVVGFGDSMTAGSAATTTAKRFINLIGTATGATVTNAGIGSTVLQNSPDASGSSRANNGRDRFVSALLGSAKKEAVFIEYGYNDARVADSPSTFNSTLFTNDMGEVLSGLIIGGYDRSKIYVATQFWITDAFLASAATGFSPQTRSGFEAYVTATRAVAAEFGVRLADMYSASFGRTDLLGADGVHPNDDGHALFASTFLSAPIANTKPAPTITSLTSGTSTSLSAAWTAPAGSVSNYTMQYAVEGSFAFTGSQTVTGLSATATGLSANTYRVRVRANFSDGTSSPWAFSAQAVTVGTVSTANLLLSSEALSTPPWTLANAYVTPDTTLAPDGATTADTIAQTTSNTNHRATQPVTLTGSSQYTASAYLKAGTSNYGAVTLNDGTQDFCGIFDLAAGTFLGWATTGVTGVSAAITAEANGFYRCSIVVNTASAAGAGNIQITAKNTNSLTPQETGALANNIIAWGAQVNAGSLATYQATQPASSNNISKSEAIGVAPWTLSGATVTADTTASPTGTQTADTLAQLATSTAHRATQNFVAAAATNYTASVHAKPGTSNYLALALFDGTTNVYAVFDLAAGTFLGYDTTNGVAGVSATITASTGGFYRCTLTAKTGNTSSSGSVQVIAKNSSSLNVVETGATTNNVIVWGAQVNTGTTATTYQPVA